MALKEQKPNLTMRKGREESRESKSLATKVTKERQRKSSRREKNLTDSSTEGTEELQEQKPRRKQNWVNGPISRNKTESRIAIIVITAKIENKGASWRR